MEPRFNDRSTVVLSVGFARGLEMARLRLRTGARLDNPVFGWAAERGPNCEHNVLLATLPASTHKQWVCVKMDAGIHAPVVPARRWDSRFSR